MARVLRSAFVENFVQTGDAYVTVPGLELAVTTRGEPVQLLLAPAAGTPDARPIGYIATFKTFGYFGFARNGVRFQSMTVNAGSADGNPGSISLPCSSLAYIDHPPAGTHTYSVFIRRSSGNNPPYQSVSVYGVQLVAVALD